MDRTHEIRPMEGNSPHEDGRTATALELLYDLVFVVAIGQGANQFAHFVAEGKFWEGIGAFLVAMFAIIWAWVNFTWFASAFDTDDWLYRLTAMGQMVGVTIMGMGLPPLFHSIDGGVTLDLRILVTGYVVMRIGMVFQWLRAAWQSRKHRKICLIYAAATTLAQIGWIVLCFSQASLTVAGVAALGLIVVEMSGPYVTEHFSQGTPWHPHHIAERYGLLTIIALGEGVIGTVASLSATVSEEGWTVEAALVAVAGMGLTFGLWWCYFLLPTGDLLHARRDSAFRWGYGSIPVIAAIVAIGAGLHVAALYIEDKSHLGALGTVLAVAIPVGIYLVGIYFLFHALFARLGLFHLLLLIATLMVLTIGPLLAMARVPMAYCLIAVMLAPVVTIVGYEVHGHRRITDALQALNHKTNTE